MRAAPVVVVGLLVAGFLTHNYVSTPIGQVACREPVTVVSVVEGAGGVVRRATTEPVSSEAVTDSVVGTAGVLGTWVGVFVSSAQGKPRAESVDQFEARAVSVQQAATQACLAPEQCPTVTPAGVAGAVLARDAASAAGWTGVDLDVAVAVAGAESGWMPDAVNTGNRDGSTDHGMWQVNSVHAGLLASGDWRDPYENARMAKAVYDEAGGWTPWVAYDSGTYLDHMQPAIAPASATACGPRAIPVGASTEPGGWGGHANGRIPAEEMCPVPGAPGHRLRCDAATALDQLRLTAAAAGRSIGITDTYRTYDSQVDVAARKGLYSQGGLAARPGTSDHGWGLAADLNLDAADLAWMRDNAGAFGFREDTPRETWHWAYYGTSEGVSMAAG